MVHFKFEYILRGWWHARLGSSALFHAVATPIRAGNVGHIVVDANDHVMGFVI